MRSSECTRNGKVLLAEEHVYFGGMNLTYQLLVLTGESMNRYRIRVIKGDEVDAAELGTDLLTAVQWYRTIVQGTVTPCALQDVMHELQYA